MRKLFPGILLLAALAAVVALYEPDTAPPETYGQQARRECAKEASRNEADQQGCYDRKITAKAFEMQMRR